MTTNDASGRRDLAALPKAHLHLHLEGAIRPSTVTDLAASRGVDAPPTRGYSSFTEFGERYRGISRLIQTEDEVRRVVREVVEDAAADGAVWLEPHLYPPRYAEVFGSREAALEAVIETAVDTGERVGVGVGFMVAVLRDVDPAEAIELAELAVRYADRGVVSFGLAADEALHPPEPFAEAFAIARAGGLISAPHAGELAGPASVIGALDALGAKRICHGVRSIEDRALVERLVADDIVLDVCPSSNVMLQVSPSLAEHPLRLLLAAGVRCTLNADDPLLFGPGLLDEYVLARTAMSLSDDELASIARTSVEVSGAPRDLIDSAVSGIERWQTTSFEPDGSQLVTGR